MIGGTFLRKRLRSHPLRPSAPLRRRLAVSMVLALLVMAVAVGATAWLSTRWSLYNQLDGELSRFAAYASGPIQGQVEDMGGLTADALQPTNLTVVLLRSDGQVTALSGEDTIVPPGASELAVAKTQQAVGAHTVTTGDGTRYRSLAAPLEVNGQYYALVVSKPLDATDRALTQLSVVLLVSSALSVLVLGTLGALLTRSALAPLHQLSRAVARVTETDDLQPIPVTTTDDLGALTTAFNTMLHSLGSSRDRQKRLIADAGHELRTPLTSMRTNVELLVADESSGMLPDGARHEILHDIAASLGEFTSLVSDLVQLSREDRVTITPEPLDFADVVRSAVQRAKRRGPGLTFDVELTPHYVMGESDTLERAVTNLLDNAVKFSPPGGTIRVQLDGDQLTISDQGPGIADEDLPHVFDRFYRSDRARNTPGTGLGLSIVAHTVASHGGTVKAGRAAEGGAEFTVRLPGTPLPPEQA